MKRRLYLRAKSGAFSLISASLLLACGKNSSDVMTLKVSNGVEIDHSEYPSVVLLRVNGRDFCTGTFVNDSQLITAASCVFDTRVSNPNIQIVEPRVVDGQLSFYPRAQAEELVLNPNYSRWQSRGVNGQDIGIIKFPAYTAPGVRSLASLAPSIAQEVAVVGYSLLQAKGDPMEDEPGLTQLQKQFAQDYVASKLDGMLVAESNLGSGDTRSLNESMTALDIFPGKPLFVRGQLAGITSGLSYGRNAEDEVIQYQKFVDINSMESQDFLERELD
ncbi:trypsin-like serine protease [Pseudobacteriovorax antillogorgiicola]|uniref:Trypsin n=1 Tax=Pseudobacteriovorax antillogorgiicola TaxID=1513793 RepID=A0A1Y6C0G9_9BACT|nr:trypsin-like serine protease [Pseudobacteriovorax antillogorgiicola]TCS52384.1 trypsin [Pseudobacteriovorax antillogorgiicola]SMF29209.1 Trypsin [Pseudobacteriovorax antillogorgiicola]